MGSILTSIVVCSVFLFVRGMSTTVFYAMCFILGMSIGYWGLFVTIASEQFGTNIRATAASTVPNFVRGGVIPITLAYKSYEMSGETVTGAVIVGVVTLGMALFAILMLEETFGKDLNYFEKS